jgi:hypothetical protein
MNLSESELNRLLLSALPHSPTVPFVWIYGIITFITVWMNPWTRNRSVIRISLASAAATAMLIVCNHFVDTESEYNARVLSKILVTGNYRLWSVDEGELIEIQAVDASDKLYLGISHAESVNQVLEEHGVPFFSLIQR